jgi:isocitrate lyase
MEAPARKTSRAPRLLVHIVQHLDAARNLLQGNHQPVLCSRKPDKLYGLRNYQVRVVKCGYGKGIAIRCAFRWIEVNSPNIEEATRFCETVRTR